MFIGDALLQGDDIDRIIPASPPPLPPSLIKKFGIECEYGRAEHGNKREEGAYGKKKSEAGAYGKENPLPLAYFERATADEAGII